MASLHDLSYNVIKLIVVAVLAVVLVIAILVDSDSSSWAVPLLGMLVAYTIGNAALSGNAPIVSTNTEE